MRRLLLGAIPFVVLAAMLALRAWDPLPLQELRWLAFDTYQRLAPRTYDPAMPVKIVDLDDELLARIGQWPWPRTQVAKLARTAHAVRRRGDRLRHRVRRTGSQLARAGAQAVAEDARGAGAARQRRRPALPRQHPRRGDRAGPGGHRLRPDQRRARRRRGGCSRRRERREPGPRSSGRPGPGRCRARWRARRAAGSRAPARKGHLRRRRRRSGAVRAAVQQRRGEPGRAGGGRARQRRAQFDAGHRPGAPARARGARACTTSSTRRLRPRRSGWRRAPRPTSSNRRARAGPVVRRAHRRQHGADRRVRDPDRPAKGASGCTSASTSRARYIPAWTVLEDDFDPNTVAGQIVFVGTSAAGLHDIRATPLDPRFRASRSTPRRSSRSCPAISSSGRISPTAWSWGTCWCSA